MSILSQLTFDAGAVAGDVEINGNLVRYRRYPYDQPDENLPPKDDYNCKVSLEMDALLNHTGTSLSRPNASSSEMIEFSWKCKPWRKCPDMEDESLYGTCGGMSQSGIILSAIAAFTVIIMIVFLRWRIRHCLNIKTKMWPTRDTNTRNPPPPQPGHPRSNFNSYGQQPTQPAISQNGFTQYELAPPPYSVAVQGMQDTTKT